MIHRSYNRYHIGDLAIHAHFLRLLDVANPAEQFEFYVHPCYFPEINPLVQDVVNVTLHPLENCPPGARDVWKNAGGFFERSRYRYDWASMHVEWFNLLSAEMGLECPIRSVEDLLFDEPCIREPLPAGIAEAAVLINNAQPCSGQFMAYNATNCLDPLIAAIAKKHSVITTSKSTTGVPCTRDYGLNCAQIGGLSLACEHVVAIVNGPAWFCLNKWNRDRMKTWLFLRDNGENMNLMPREHYASTLDMAMKKAQILGLA